MAARTPAAPPAPNGTAVPAAPPVPPLPAVAKGFVRLTDVRAAQKGSDTYSVLRPFVGQDIIIGDVAIAADEKSGTMQFCQLADDNVVVAEDGSAAIKDGVALTSSPIPKGAFRAILRAVKRNVEDTIVCRVEESKRGISLR